MSLTRDPRVLDLIVKRLRVDAMTFFARWHKRDKAGFHPIRNVNERWAITADSVVDHLTALLLFDRVYINRAFIINLLLFKGEYMSLEDLAYVYLLNKIDAYDSMTFHNSDIEESIGVWENMSKYTVAVKSEADKLEWPAESAVVRGCLLEECIKKARVYEYRRRGYNVIPCYTSIISYDGDNYGGSVVAYKAALENLPVVYFVNIGFAGFEEAMRQITDFRDDSEAVRKYRDLRLWLEHNLKADSVSHASDIIAQKIDDYTWAGRKHGLKTITSTQLEKYRNRGGCWCRGVSAARANRRCDRRGINSFISHTGVFN